MVEASCALPVRETSKFSMRNPNLLALAVLAGTFAACDSEGVTVATDHPVNGALVAADHQLAGQVEALLPACTAGPVQPQAGLASGQGHAADKARGLLGRVQILDADTLG